MTSYTGPTYRVARKTSGWRVIEHCDGQDRDTGPSFRRRGGAEQLASELRRAAHLATVAASVAG